MSDLISRQMLLEYIHGEPVGRLLCDKYNLDGLIEQLPPAEPKTGKWNRLDMDTFNCNKCGATFVLNQGSEKMHFCPNCGADMRGEQDG